MPPRKELCRNFQRGSCQYGERCKFLHVTPQQSKPNSFGFGMQNGTQFQGANLQQQKPSPYGFGVQNSSQSRGSSDFGSKQNQFKPFENKWTRFSPINTGSSSALRQPDNQPPAPNHKCTDPESCKSQIIEDFKHEKPLWNLTCYGHLKSGPCDIFGDISYEELRAAAYDDAKRGLTLHSIVERERGLLNSKLLEFENLLSKPYTVPPNSTLDTQSFPGASPNASQVAVQNSAPPSVSSFSQLGASLNTGFAMRPAAPPDNAFGQQNPSHNFSQASNGFGTNNFSFANAGSLGSSFTFGNSAPSAERNPFSTAAVSPQFPGSASNQSMPFSVRDSASNAVGQSTVNVPFINNMPREIDAGDNSIWLKEEWNPGEIPEDAPPDKYIF